MNAHATTWGLEDLMEEPYEPLLEDLRSGSEVFLPTSFHDYHEEAPLIKLKHLSEWPAQFPVALAMQVEDIPAILARFEITPERFELLKPLPAFRKAVAEAQRDVREQGHGFRLKCRGIAEDFLDTLYFALQDSTVGLSTKIDVFKYITKMGGLEPVPVPATAASSAVAVQININI